jgi:hypothetical protein
MFKYKDRYIDGIAPYFFKKGKNLFIKLMKMSKPALMMSIKNEHTIYKRLLLGVRDINNLFLNGSSEMCYYIDSKSYVNNFKLCLREYFFLTVFCIMSIFIELKKHIPLCLTNNLIYYKFNSDINDNLNILYKKYL